MALSATLNSQPMQQYLDLMRHVMENGHDKSDRTGTGTRSVFGWQMRFDLSQGFPAVTTKKLHLKSIIHELLWFLQGDTNIRYLQENGVKIWDEWADENGDLGPVYGKQWRRWETPDGRVIDQITQLVNSLKNNPDSRRHIVSAWNPGDVDNPASSSPHTGRKSADTDSSISTNVTKPSNIASYALLTMMLARVCGYQPGDFVHTFGDAHIYSNHFAQAQLQLARTPKALPTMWINPEVNDLLAFRFEDFRLDGYEPHPHIAAPVAV